MATELRAFAVVIPAGTALAAPVTVDVSFAPMITERIDWQVPHGSSGLMGWRLTSGGAQVIPKNPGGFLVADGQAGDWQFDGLHDSGKWEVTGYNTGVFPHVVNVRFHVAPIGERAAPLSSLAWLTSGRYGTALAEVGALAAAPEAVSVPASVLWPPRRR